jgi:thioredoxin reductase
MDTPSSLTDFLFAGNGPNGLALSYILSGYWPYLSAGEHINPLLNARLRNVDREISLLQQDLGFLAEGLEGRSSNSVALLFDELLQPGADLGSEFESSIIWSRDHEKSISHLVIGNSMPGGSWNGLPGHIKTLSPLSWLQLPGYSLSEWVGSRAENHQSLSHDEFVYRIKVGDVRQYYADYVNHTGVAEHLVNNATVVSLRRLENFSHYEVCSTFTSKLNGVLPDECGDLMYRPFTGCFCSEPDHVPWRLPHEFESRPQVSASSKVCVPGGYRFQLTMKTESHNEMVGMSAQPKVVKIQAKCVVLAVGLGSPKHIGVPGEHMPFVFHRYPDDPWVFTDAQLRGNAVVVVGSGLCAADVILMSLKMGLKVMHIFRRKASDSQLIFNKLPPGGYPEYDKICHLMHGKVTDEQYKPFECHSLQHIDPERICTVVSSEGIRHQIRASLVFILIGSNSDLTFLPNDLQRLGVQPMKPVSKENPVDVDPITYEIRGQPGLYAIGPLVGDNFVRFGIGGALGVTSHLVKESLM